HLAIAPTKNINRFEWFLEKATEIGIDEISPIICDHSERKTLKTDRLNKILITAIKQSIKVYLPKLNSPLTFNEFIQKPCSSFKFIACIDEEHQLNLKKAYQKGKDVVIIIGPEGDFSREEIKLAKELKYLPISLGKSRLRTETAAIVACHTIQLLNE
ncbi:MAG: RNA methyltransferase, partial [Bacteroidetes bacterium]|nr:RNA methyltransferase [Bacteroidota bacterium]